MDIKDALKITGWQLCDFNSDGSDSCNSCKSSIKKGENVYYERTCHESNEGEYYCEACTIATPDKWEKEALDWDEYESSLK